MKELKSIQTNPFQRTGKLKKKNFYDKYGKIFTKHTFSEGIKTVPVMKESGEQWSREDKPTSVEISGFETNEVLKQISTLNLKKLLKACEILRVSSWGKTKDGKSFKCNEDQLVSKLKKSYVKEKSPHRKLKFEETVMGVKKQ